MVINCGSDHLSERVTVEADCSKSQSSTDRQTQTEWSRRFVVAWLDKKAGTSKRSSAREVQAIAGSPYQTRLSCGAEKILRFTLQLVYVTGDLKRGSSRKE